MSARRSRRYGAHLVGGHAGILPPRPLPLLPGGVGAGAHAGLADLPHPGHLRGIGVQGHGGRVGHVVQHEHQLPGLLGGRLELVGAELRDQEAAAGREQVGRERVLALDGAQQAVVEGFQADGSSGEDLGDVVARRGDVGVAEYQQHARLGAGDEAKQGLDDSDARALAAHQRPGDVEAVLGQQLVEPEARDPAGDVGEARADQVGRAIAQVEQTAVDLAAAATRADDGLQVLVGGGTDAQAQAVVGDDIEFVDVVDRLAAHDRVHAAGVVADHAAQRAAVVGDGVGAEGQVATFSGRPQGVEDDPGLDAGGLPVVVEHQDLVHIA